MKTAPLPPDEPERLRLLRELRILGSVGDPALDALARLVCRHTGWSIGGISLVDADRQWFPAMEGLPGVFETPRDVAFCAHTILSDAPLEVPDATADPRFADNPLVTGPPYLRTYAAFPLTVDGCRIGTVCAMDSVARAPLDDARRTTLADLAVLAGQLLESRLRAERNRLQEARVRGASRAGSDWLWETDADGVITWVSDSVEAHTGWPAAAEIGRSGPEINLARDDEHHASYLAYLDALRRRTGRRCSTHCCARAPTRTPSAGSPTSPAGASRWPRRTARRRKSAWARAIC
jgi:GAF domain-containing protein